MRDRRQEAGGREGRKEGRKEGRRMRNRKEGRRGFPYNLDMARGRAPGKPSSQVMNGKVR